MVQPIGKCNCCGSESLASTSVLWKSLIEEWRLAPSEVAYVDRQQGFHCAECRSNLRAMALAMAVMGSFNYEGLFKDFVAQKHVQKLSVLEINEAYTLSRYMAQIPGHTLGSYPQVDMSRLPYADDSFDLVMHSDTLEHVQHPVRALSECRRVLRRGGVCAFTVPIIVDRLTISRDGFPPSYHGSPGERPDDQIVHTEYGGDAWKHVVQAGFRECRIFSIEYPSAQALVGVKS